MATRNLAYDLEAQGQHRRLRDPGAQSWRGRLQRRLQPRGQSVCQTSDAIRLDFVRKVYGLLLAQISLTAFVAALCTLWTPLNRSILQFAAHHPNLLQFLLVVPSIATLLILACVKRQHPLNLICLWIFTGVTSLKIGLLCAAFNEAGLGEEVLSAAAVTLLIFLGLTVYVRRSRRDFSHLRGLLAAGLVGSLAFGLLAMAIPALNRGMLGLARSVFGALLFSGYIVFDTWRLEKVHGCDDYIFAVIELYLDVINLFVHVLRVMSKVKRNR